MTTHLFPRWGLNFTHCCAVPVPEIADTDRLTHDRSRVTCEGSEG